MAKAVRDPLLPLTHYQKIGKQPIKSKNPYTIWVLVALILILVGAGIMFLHREIEALNKETDIMAQPTIEVTESPKVTETPVSIEPTKVAPTKSTVIPTLPMSTQAPAASPTEAMTLCTQEAMQCPDGSWVGRTGPQCEFKCPGQ